MTIKAETHTDDFAIKVAFDATAWFEQASDADILGLSAIEWGGDYAADDVARFFEDKNADVGRMFTYLSAKPLQISGDTCGFECHVDERDAMKWLAENKPELASKIGDGGPSFPGY